MTEVDLLNQIRDVSKLLLQSPHDYMIAQTNKNGVRVNTGRSIHSLSKNIINFRCRYAIISKVGIENALDVINTIARLMPINYVTVIPKRYGYMAYIYNEGILVHKYKIKLIWSRSTILCYLMLFYKIITNKQ